MKIVELSQRRRGVVGKLAIGLLLGTQCCFGVLFILIFTGAPLAEPAALQDLLGSFGTRASLLALWAIATALLGLLVALTPGRLRTFRTVAPDPIWRIRRGVSEVLSRHPAARLPEDTVTPGSSQAAPAPRDAEPVSRCRANDP
jgi:hypothetical protein